MQRPLRHHHALPLQQLVHLDDRQPVLVEPLLELVSLAIEQPAGLAPPVGAMRPHLLHDLPEQQVGQLVLAAGPVQAQLDRSIDVAADRLAVHPRQLADRPLTLPAQPQPQNFSYFEHTNLPERHAASCGSRRQRRRQAERPRHRNWRTPEGGPITGERVVPSLATRWSHPTGETHAQVVPSHWRATLPAPRITCHLAAWQSREPDAVRRRVSGSARAVGPHTRFGDYKPELSIRAAPARRDRCHVLVRTLWQGCHFRKWER